jgi:hypothetical protein
MLKGKVWVRWFEVTVVSVDGVVGQVTMFIAFVGNAFDGCRCQEARQYQSPSCIQSPFAVSAKRRIIDWMLHKIDDSAEGSMRTGTM